MENWYWYVAGLIILLMVFGIYRHYHPGSGTGIKLKLPKGGAHAFVVLVLVGAIIFFKLTRDEILVPILACSTLYFVFVGWFLDHHHDIKWGKAMATLGVLTTLVVIGVKHHQKNKEGVKANVSQELRSFNNSDLESRYGRPIEWLWEIQVFRNGRLATNRSSKDVKCIEWTTSTLVVQVPLGGDTKMELRWNDLFGGDTLIQGYTERTRGGFNLQPSNVPGPEVSKEHSEPTLFEGTLEIPIKSMTGPKETLSFRLRPQTSYEALLKGWIPGAKKL